MVTVGKWRARIADASCVVPEHHPRSSAKSYAWGLLLWYEKTRIGESLP